MPVSNNTIPTAEQNPIVGEETPVVENPIVTPTPMEKPQPETSNGVHGLTEAEKSDPNSIQVDIADEKAPIVVLFGPPACGKTMTLVRLTRFLQSEEYTVSPIESFRPSADTNYSYICKHFNETINDNKAAGATDRISFMLVEVLKGGKRICQILEAPGEYYFDPKKPNAPFPNYVNAIIGAPNRKIWTIMVEPNWKDKTDRMNYVTRIAHLKQSMRTKDSVVFIYNKIDCTNFVRSIGHINRSQAINDVKDYYKNIFVPFLNQNPISKLWREYNCDFVPFQTGFYSEAVDGITYQEGPREYCVKLWDCIKKKIYG